MRPRLLALPCLMLLIPAVGSAQAPAPAPAPSAGRTPDAILDDFAKAVVVPGKSKRKPRSLHVTGKLTLKAMGLEGTMESWSLSDGKNRQLMRLPGIGDMAGGSNGRRTWSQDPINGLRILSGPESDQAKLDGAWMADLNLKKLYPKRRAVPVPPAASKIQPAAPAAAVGFECLEMTPAAAGLFPVTMCFDPKTHLRVFLEGKQHTPQGVVPFVRVQSDYREVEGWLFPHQEDFTVGPASMSFRIEQVVFNEKIPASTFQMPRPPAPTPAGK